MRKHVLILGLALLLGIASKAQRSIRLGYVDMNYILENVPEYKEGQAQLDKRVAEWKKEIEQRNNEIERMKQALENERILLTQELIVEREEEIAFLQNELLEYQQKRFGPEGDLVIQRSILVEPIQDQVFNAVQEIAANRQYDFILDKSSDLVMLYADKRHDVSDQILLSIKRSSKRKQVQNREDRKDLEQAEELTAEQIAEQEEREAAQSEKEKEREALIEARKALRDSIQEAKKAEYERRRKELLEARQRRKDSLDALRSGQNSSNPPGMNQKNPQETMTPQEKRQQILLERQRRRDSIIESRKKQKDTIN